MVNCVVVDDDQDIVDVFCELLNLIGLDVLATGTDQGLNSVNLYGFTTKIRILFQFQKKFTFQNIIYK